MRGVYGGYFKDLILDDNFRQGVSLDDGTDLLFEDCDFVTGDLGFAATMSGLQEAPVENLCAATARPPHPRCLCAVAVLWLCCGCRPACAASRRTQA